MANTLLTPDMITREFLRIFKNKLVITRNCNRQYDKSFAQDGAEIGATLRIRKPSRYLVTDGPALVVQDNVQQYTSLTVSSQKHVGVAFTDAELALSLTSFSETYLVPAASQLAATVDADVASCYKWIGQSVGTPGTTPASTAVMLSGQQKLNEAAAPENNRSLLINPAANGALVESMKGLLNPGNAIGGQFKSGMIGSGLGYDEVAMTQSINSFTTGSRLSGAVVATTISAQGATTLVITTSGAASQTVKLGDVFTVSSCNAINPQTRQSTGSLYQFVVLADATAATNTLTVTVAPMYAATEALATMDALPVATTGLVTWVGAASTAYPQNLILQRDALTFATADLILPKGMDMASRINDDGISLRFVRGFDIVNSRMLSRMDILYGFAVIRPEGAVRMWG